MDQILKLAFEPFSIFFKQMSLKSRRQFGRIKLTGQLQTYNIEWHISCGYVAYTISSSKNTHSYLHDMRILITLDFILYLSFKKHWLPALVTHKKRHNNNTSLMNWKGSKKFTVILSSPWNMIWAKLHDNHW